MNYTDIYSRTTQLTKITSYTNIYTRSWPVGLWGRAHGGPVSTRVDNGEIMWRISLPNMVSESKVQSKIKNNTFEKNSVPTLFDYSHMRSWRGFACEEGCRDGLCHIDKLKMMCALYKLLETFFPLSYHFEMLYIAFTYEVGAPRVSPLISW